MIIGVDFEGGSTHPERFVRKLPEPPATPTIVWINAPSPTVLTMEAQQ